MGLAVLAVDMAWWSRAHGPEQSAADTASRPRPGAPACGPNATRAALAMAPGAYVPPGENAGSADRLLPAAGDQPAPRAAAPSGRASTRSMRLPSIAVISKLQSAQSMRSPSSGRWPETKISKPATVL